MRERFLHRLFSNLVEDDALRLFQADGLGQMPSDRFALTVRVGGENDFVGLLRVFLEAVDDVLLGCDDLIARFEVVLNIHRIFVALGQVADVAHGGTHGEPLAEVFLNSLGFCRRLDDYQFHTISREGTGDLAGLQKLVYCSYCIMAKKKSIGFEELDAKLDRVIGSLATKGDIRELKEDICELNAKVDRVIDTMATKEDIASLEGRMDQFDERLKRVIIALDHVKSGFDNMTLEYAAISAKLARYEKWFEILAKKTRVKLTI